MARPRRQIEQPGARDLYDRMLAAQGGMCALCPNTPKSRRFHIDHDHATGDVRGLLCYRCNRALPAYLRAEWLLRAAAYVDRTAVIREGELNVSDGGDVLVLENGEWWTLSNGAALGDQVLVVELVTRPAASS